MQRRVRWAIAALVGVSAVAVPHVSATASTRPARPATTTAAATNGSRPVTLYVPIDENKAIYPIDTTTNVAGKKIPVKAEPITVAISPDGLSAYVTTTRTDNVVPVDLTTNTAGARIELNSAFNIAIAPDGGRAYVTKGGGSSVAVVDLASHFVVDNIKVGVGPYGIGITPNGAKAYVVNSSDQTVSPVDLATDKAKTAIPVGPDPRGLAVAPDGKTVYAVNTGDGTVTPIDTATDTAGPAFAVGEFAETMAITPDGKTGFVSHYDDALGGSVTPIDLATRTAGTPIAVPEPRQVVVTPDGKTVYADGWTTDTVTPIDVATLTAKTPIPVGTGRFSFWMAISPDQAPIAAFTATRTGDGPTWSFDASASIAPSSPIVKYRWRFGDGGLQTTHTPFVTHQYTSEGRFKVVLTETDAAGTSTTQVFGGQTMLRNGGKSAHAVHFVTVH